MNIGQKVKYENEKYVVADKTGNDYIIIKEDLYVIYNLTGLNVPGSILKTDFSPVGTELIIDDCSNIVGFANISEEEVDILDESIPAFDRSLYEEEISFI